jgi:hypothetical protein
MHPSGTCIQVCLGAKEIQDRRTVLSEPRRSHSCSQNQCSDFRT